LYALGVAELGWKAQVTDADPEAVVEADAELVPVAGPPETVPFPLVLFPLVLVTVPGPVEALPLTTM